MGVEDAIGSNSGWSSAEKLSDGGSISNDSDARSDSAPIDILPDDHHIGVPLRKKYASLSTCLQTHWPIPIAGLAYLLHLRYRRYSPRKLPRITPLKPFELYIGGSLVINLIVEQQRWHNNLKRDRDLAVLECFARVAKMYWVESQATLKEKENLHNEMYRVGFFPHTGRLSEKVRWMHNHWWAGSVAWNVAMLSLCPLGAGSTDVSAHDLDICISHIANFIETDGSILSMGHTVPFVLGFLGLTPFGMWVRFLGRPSLILPIHGLQRILFYLAAYVSIGRQYQLIQYPTTLHDKHSVANMLLAEQPKLQQVVDEFLRHIKSGAEDASS